MSELFTSNEKIFLEAITRWKTKIEDFEKTNTAETITDQQRLDAIKAEMLSTEGAVFAGSANRRGSFGRWRSSWPCSIRRPRPTSSPRSAPTVSTLTASSASISNCATNLANNATVRPSRVPSSMM